MFGSFFRATVVIGTIYAISPVKLDATPLPTGPQAKTGMASAIETATLANPATTPKLLATALSVAQGQSSQDQIGDLIALGKDVCLANPGLCVEAAKALQDKSTPAPSKPTAKVQAPLKPDPSPKAAETAKPKQPDALAALIEKTVPQTAQPLAKPAR
jgi:hypothetical protein